MKNYNSTCFCGCEILSVYEIRVLTIIERNSDENTRGTYLELQMCYYIPLYWTNAPRFAATLINENSCS